MTTNETTPTLRRSLSLNLVTFYGLGNILGAGIYVLVGRVAGEAGYLAPVSFLIASVIAGLTAFTFAELASRYPVSAGEAVYVFKGFNNRHLSVFVGLLIIMSGVVSAATITRGVVGYLNVFIPVPGWLVITVLLFLLGVVAIWGIVESVRTAAALTLVEIAGLLLILLVSAPYFRELPQQLAVFTPGLELSIWPGIFSGAFLAFYAFVGFEDMVNVAEEVKSPRRNLPRSILLALGTSTVLYVAVAFAVLLVLTPDELAVSDAPLAEVYQRITGRTPVMISLVAMVAVINGALVQIIMASRVCYGMSKQAWLPAILSTVSPATRTPTVATIIITLIILLMALSLPIEQLARITSFFLLVIFSLVNVALFRIKGRDGPTPDGVFQVPRAVPAAGFSTALALLLTEIYNQFWA